ncbi:MAG: hypothetical protein IT381_32305 [Deltaproteobacteria bacterium]|nr:hypothetical protein [Deltaproteobacteria bacterium]
MSTDTSQRLDALEAAFAALSKDSLFDIGAMLLEVVDDNGTSRAQLSGTGLLLFDEDGKPALIAGANNGAAHMTLSNDEPRLVIESSVNDCPRIQLMGARGIPRLDAAVDPRGSPSLGVLDASGRGQAALLVNPRGDGRIFINEGGK